MKITYIANDEANNWYHAEWRWKVLNRAINRLGSHTSQIINHKEFGLASDRVKRVCGESEILIIYKYLYGETLTQIQHWKARGKIVIVDFDHALQLLDKKNSEYKFWFEGKDSINSDDVIHPAPITQFKWGLQMVDGATVPSMRLADDWGEYTNTSLIHDYIDLEVYLAISKMDHEGIILGWKGEIHEASAFIRSGARDAVAELLKKKQDVKVMLCTDSNKVIEMLNFPKNQVIQQPMLNGKNWPAPLGYFDIGLVPLFSDYDQRNGLGPLIEFLVTKTPWIASQGSAFHQVKEYGCLAQNSKESWQRNLLDIIENLEVRKIEAGRNPYLFGLAKNVDENILQVIHTYAKIGDRI
ncbi:MAG: hypothetical protein JEZ06_06155 [Anaerolineaceae bacterium]|nr:hypothetical protein [Anaerolineaceae bacterium]